MNTDPALRLLLGLILLCLLVLVAQGFDLFAGPAADGGAYRVNVIKSKPPWLLRFNVVTGQVEQLELRGGKGRWMTLGEPEGDLGEGEAGQEALDEPFAAVEPSPTRPPVGPPPSPAAAPVELTALLEAVQPGNPREIRIWAASLLGSYVAKAPDNSIPALIQTLDDPDPELVLAATRSLASTRHPDALPALKKLESHPDASVQAAAREAVAAQE